jgi:hypothetical protein
MFLNAQAMRPLLRDEPLSKMFKYAKARSQNQFDFVFDAVLEHMRTLQPGVTLPCTAGVKRDGHTVIIECNAKKQCVIYTRTRCETERLVLSVEETRKYLTELALEMLVQLKGELVGYIDGLEVGFLRVLTCLNEFKANGNQNVGRVHIKVHVFGVHSADGLSGDLLSPEDLENVLRSFVEGGQNPLVSIIRGEHYRMRLHSDGGHQAIEFLAAHDDVRVAASPAAFWQYLLDKADRSGIEGYVVTVPPYIFHARPVVPDCFHTGRFQHMVKVKRSIEDLHLLACRVLKQKRNQQGRLYPVGAIIALFGRSADGELVYVGKACDNERLQGMLPKDKFAFTVLAGKEGMARLYTQDPRVINRLQTDGSAIQIRTSCNAIAIDHYHVTGLKYKIEKTQGLDFAQLSNTREKALQDSHFVAILQACKRFASKKRTAATPPDSDDEAGAMSPKMGSRTGSPYSSQDSASQAAQRWASVAAPSASNSQVTLLVSSEDEDETQAGPPPATQTQIYVTPSSPPVKRQKLVYIDPPVLTLAADQRELLTRVETLGGHLIEEDATSCGRSVIGVFTQRSVSLRHGPGVCYFFKQHHEKSGATVVVTTVDGLEAALAHD